MNKPSREWEAPKPAPKVGVSSLDPEIAALLGLGADAVGTYQALKTPGRTEANPIFSKMFNNDPLKTGLGVAATGLGGMLLRKAARNKGGVLAKIADMVGGQVGADGLSLGIQNLQDPGADRRNGFEQNADRQREAVSGLRKN
jgi:hypothetical protein